MVTDVEFIAKEIVMLSNGKIIRSGSPSKLLKELDGKVWNIFLSDNEIDEVNTGYKVSNISRDADGVIARIIADSYDGRWQKELCGQILRTCICILMGTENGYSKKRNM